MPRIAASRNPELDELVATIGQQLGQALGQAIAAGLMQGIQAAGGGVTAGAARGPGRPAGTKNPSTRVACIVPECGRPGAAKGLCSPHYGKSRRLKMGGGPFTPAQLKTLAADGRAAAGKNGA